MRRTLKIIVHILIAATLTILTQVGGVIYLACVPIFSRLRNRTRHRRYRLLLNFSIFAAFYLVSTFFIIPLCAALSGRVPLPVFETRHLKPLTILTCVLNRHYVKKDLREIAFTVSEKIHNAHPGSVVSYMDANFPFIDGFPLVPHLTHNDGKKLDLAFFYKLNGTETNRNPSVIGYGASEEPRKHEQNFPEQCARQGYWQYSLMSKWMPLSKGFELDAERTRGIVSAFANQARIGKIFIEPHLKTRLGLQSPKIRFHGCRAVRHDDHFHVVLI